MMLSVQEDLYNGWIISSSSIVSDPSGFERELLQLMADAKQKDKWLIWLDLNVQQSKQIAIALEAGFEFHNCEPDRTTLIYRVREDAYVPVPPSHTVGVGAIVISPDNELLMVRDRIGMQHSLYKLPGGMLEEGDRLVDGVIREVYEETGIHATFIKMVALLNAHPYRYNKSNMYIVFELKPMDFAIEVMDTHEIEEAIWMPLDQFFAHQKMSMFQKELVHQALSHKGLVSLESSQYFKGKKHVEVYA